MSERGGGPYREPADPKTAELERMRKQIETEGKYGILIPENMKAADEIPEFTKLVNKKIDHKDIVFYSATAGKLRYKYRIERWQSTDSSEQQVDPYGYGNDHYLLLFSLRDKNRATCDLFSKV